MLTKTKNPESRGSETGHGRETKVCTQSTVNAGDSQDNIQALQVEARNHGIDIPGDLIPGKMIRFGPNKKHWCVFHTNANGTAGASFGDWGTDFKSNWFSGGGFNGSEMSPEDHEEIQRHLKQVRQQADLERAETQQQAALDAKEYYNKAIPADTHPYLDKKQIQPHNARISEDGTVLLIPAWDTKGNFATIQRVFLDADGAMQKRFYTDGKAKDVFNVLGDVRNSDITYLVEGFATGATVHECTDKAVVVCFTASNLMGVAVYFQEQFPDKRLIITADEDIKTEQKTGKNPGRLAAQAVSEKLGIGVAHCTVDSDFNDLLCQQGKQAVMDALKCVVGEKEPPWELDRAEEMIKNARDGPSSKKISLVQDILGNNNFDDLEMDIIRAAIKTHLKINKKAQKSFIRSTEDDPKESDTRTHIELAMDWIKDQYPDRKKAVGCEGAIWKYSHKTGLFEQEALEKLELVVGNKYKASSFCKRKSDYSSVVKLGHCAISDDNFFQQAPYGLPGNNSFYQVHDGIIKIEPYSPELRQRFKLSCDPDANHPTPIFTQYLDDTFKGEQYQVALLQCIVGALITGTARKLQKAFLFYGSGMNGKSVMLDICNGMFSDDLKCSIKPDELSSEYYKAQIAGKVLNVVGELDKSNPIKADFKDVVGCDTPVTARLPYQKPFTFTPGCGHMFACNGFPQTRDHSYGFYRRWAILHFKHRVDASKRIPDLGKLILKKEMPGVLSWAMEGARILIEKGFVLPYSVDHDLLLSQWKNMQDTVTAFLNDDEWILQGQGMECEKNTAYIHYRDYCYQSNVKSVGLQHFYSRVSETFSEYKPPYGKRCFLGFGIIKQED